MEQSDRNGNVVDAVNESAQAREASSIAPLARPVAEVRPAQGAAPCPTCGAGATANDSYVYVLGQIEKEVAQATGRAETAGRTDRQAFFQVLSQRENRYLARQLCWVLSVQGVETYLLQPRDPMDLDLLISAIEPHETPWISTVIGARGPIAPPEYCNGLMVPIVVYDQIYSFSRDALIEAIPRPDGIPAADFGPAARELFERIMQMADNAGSTDENRALNYLSVRYPNIYARAAEAFAANSSLSGLEVRPSPLSGTRNIVEVIFAFTNRATDFTEKSFVRVDVTEEFPFLVTKLSPYYDR
jgi:PatG C-terminal